MSIFFNLGSLLLGILSWIMPIIALKNYKNGHNIANYTILSFSSCAAALIFQLLEIKNTVILEDWSAIMDTIGVISFVSIILVLVTASLNIIVNHLCKNKNK